MKNTLNNKSHVPQSLAVLMKKEFPPNHWLIEGLIPSQAITILSGAPTSCKTWIMLEAAIAIAQGEELFGQFPTERTGVLMIDEESGERLLQSRFLTLRSPDDLSIHYLSMNNRKVTDEYVDELIHWCHANDVGVIMMDSLVRMHDGDENAARDIAKVFGLLRRLTSAGLTVLIAHHNRKTGINDTGPQTMRGSSDILASIDCQIAVSRPQGNDLLTLQQTKCRIAPELPLIEVRFSQHDNYSEFEYLGQKDNPNKKLEFKNKILEIIIVGNGLNQTEIAMELETHGLKRSPKTLRANLESMEREGLIKVSKGDKNSKSYHLIETVG